MARNKECCEKDPFVGIAGAVGGTLLVMVLFVVLFAREQSWVLAPIASAMTILGIALGYYASQPRTRSRNRSRARSRARSRSRRRR